MGCSGLLILGLVLNVAHCLETPGPGEEPAPVIAESVTAVLGEVTYLRCRYLGNAPVEKAEWKRKINSKTKSKGFAGFRNGQLYRSGNFSKPDSATNLTVSMWVSSVDVEGEYICEFETDTGEFSENAYVTVVARPDIETHVNAETISGIHYQSVLCSAVGSRPMAQISWLVNGRPPSGDNFKVSERSSAHSNSTSTLSSILRFPTHLQDEDSVVCVVKHPTLPHPTLIAVKVETYVRPNVTVKAEMVQQGGNDFWVVSCISSGGRPETDISLALSTNEELQTENSTDSDMFRVSVSLPATTYEGCNVTCVFAHPKFSQNESRVLTLPSFRLSGAELDSDQRVSGDLHGAKSLELQEGQSEILIGLKVIGNVPRYNVTCTKDDAPLPQGLELEESSLRVRGPLARQHAGLYECIFSYHHLKTLLQINLTVKAHAVQPVPPTIQVDLQTKDGHRVMECSAADAVPAANVSWLLPDGERRVSWSNFTSHNGSHSVREVVLLPACLLREYKAKCVINHPAFEEPENRSVTLPLCARPNITITSSTEWKDGKWFTKVDCWADSVASAATITWQVHGDNTTIGSQSEPEVQADGVVSARRSVRFLSSLYAGQKLTCVVVHPSLEAPETRTIKIPVLEVPLLSVSLRQQDSSRWLAVCECRAMAVGTNLTWVLPAKAAGQTLLHMEYKGPAQKARLAYQFTLARHEGQNLTCVYQFEHTIIEKKTVHVPRYYISAVRVLNHTTVLKNHYGSELAIRRVTLQEKKRNQKILLQVEGNVKEYDLCCKRSDGSFVYMEGLAIVFQSEVTERDEGLYTCRASFDRHSATVKIQVEVTSEDKQLALVALTCISLAGAIVVIFVVTLWVCCTINHRTQYKKGTKVKKESLSALTALMQEASSPNLQKPALMEKDNTAEMSDWL
ncbi:uncharacterized protein LOC115052654 isoform X2 [Echeneis naucrates]|uniref:uncharacterized protein LOC115052654 isoform X2 n=1 Tax=Echeneis naucrates TaxID=173247 RepID=UPI001114077D|nr:uncharacterized protein LOC115052654 isoform X2 [Echeneis naucrates]